MNVNEICRHLDDFNEELRSIRHRLTMANDRIAPRETPPATASEKEAAAPKTDTGIFVYDVSNMLEKMNGYISALREEVMRYEAFTGTTPPVAPAPGAIHAAQDYADVLARNPR